jgi:hypothetical protein
MGLAAVEAQRRGVVDRANGKRGDNANSKR